MIEKLTPGTAHLTRSGVPVYLVNSHSHMQAVHRTCSRPLDVGIERSSARMSGSRPMGDAHPSNAAADCGHRSDPQHLPRHAGILEEIIAGRALQSFGPGVVAGRHECRRQGCAHRFGPASAGPRRLQRHSRCGAEQHLLFGDPNRHARRRLGGVVFDCLPRSAEWLWQFGHFSPPLSGDVSEPVDPAVGWEKFTAGD